MSKHHDLQMLGLKLNKNEYSLEVVGRARKFELFNSAL